MLKLTSLTKIFLPTISIWFVVFLITRRFDAPSAVAFVLGLFLVPFGVSNFYAEKIRARYPILQVHSVELCPLCAEKIPRDRFTRLLFLMPYCFKTLRHYERTHKELAGDARKSRLFLTAAFNAIILGVSGVTGLGNLPKTSAQLSSLEALADFLVPFLSVQFVAWVLVHHVLVRKRGQVLGP